MFNSALSAADITARWDQSLTSRIASSLEPNLAIFYNFNTPAVAGGTVVRARVLESMSCLLSVSPRAWCCRINRTPAPPRMRRPTKERLAPSPTWRWRGSGRAPMATR